MQNKKLFLRSVSRLVISALFLITATSTTIAKAVTKKMLCQHTVTAVVSTREKCRTNEVQILRLSQFKGDTGVTGLSGAVGARGETGAPGVTGAAGAVGATGGQGLIGPAGAPGNDGSPGQANVYFSAPNANLSVTSGFLSPIGVTTLQETSSAANATLGVNCTATEMRVNIATAPGGAQPRVFTLYVNDSPTALTCTIGISELSCVGVSRVSVAATDNVSIKAFIGGGAYSTPANISFVCQQ